MTVTWAIVILIVAVLIWLAITAIWLLGRVKRVKNHLSAIKESPVMLAVKSSKRDFERLNQAIGELQAQLTVLRSAQEALVTSLRELRGLSFSADVALIENAYRDLIAVLR